MSPVTSHPTHLRPPTVSQTLRLNLWLCWQRSLFCVTLICFSHFSACSHYLAVVLLSARESCLYSDISLHHCSLAPVYHSSLFACVCRTPAICGGTFNNTVSLPLNISPQEFIIRCPLLPLPVRVLFFHRTSLNHLHTPSFFMNLPRSLCLS